MTTDKILEIINLLEKRVCFMNLSNMGVECGTTVNLSNIGVEYSTDAHLLSAYCNNYVTFEILFTFIFNDLSVKSSKFFDNFHALYYNQGFIKVENEKIYDEINSRSVTCDLVFSINTGDVEQTHKRLTDESYRKFQKQFYDVLENEVI
jgi:hypothetical protein